MKLNTNNTTSRILLVSMAILVIVVVWIAFGWELGLDAAWLLVCLSPELLEMVKEPDG